MFKRFSRNRSKTDQDFEIKRIQNIIDNSIKEVVQPFDQLKHELDEEKRLNASLVMLDSFKVMDNSPISGIHGFGQNQTQKYYFKSAPSKWDLWKMSRDVSIADRLVFGFSRDMWSNYFTIKIKEVDQEVEDEKNKLLKEHLKEINFWEQAYRWTSFERQQGESLLMVWREEDVNATNLLTAEPNLNSPIVRVESINFLDYNLIFRGKYGIPEEYSINFARDRNSTITYHVHPQRALRLKTRSVTYDEYGGQSVLRSIYSDLMTLVHVGRAVSDASFRWGVGIPFLLTKGIKNKAERTALKNALQSINSQAMGMMPSEKIESIQMLGKDMANLNIESLVKPIIDNIIAGTAYPRNILLGENNGVVRAGEVNQNEYLALIEQEQSRHEPMIREFFDIDPFIVELLGDLEYEIFWGLRHVMTEEKEADYRDQIYKNAQTLMDLGVPYNEVLLEAKKPIFETFAEGSDELYKRVFGFTIKEIAQLPGSFVNLLFTGQIAMDEEGKIMRETNENPDDMEEDNSDEKDLKEDKKETKEDNSDEKDVPMKDVKKNLQINIDVLRQITGSLNDASKELGVSKGTLNTILQNCRG